jgi:hypothetical protein
MREVAAELEKQRAEVGIDAAEIELVDHCGARHDPRAGLPVRCSPRSRVGQPCTSRRFSARSSFVFSYARPMKTTRSAAVKPARRSRITSSLRWPLAKSTYGIACVSARGCTSPLNRSVILAISAVEATRNPRSR